MQLFFHFPKSRRESADEIGAAEKARE